MDARTTLHARIAAVLGGAAVLGFAFGSTALGGGPDDGGGAVGAEQASPTPTVRVSPVTPTATPRPDRFSPDFGFVTEVRQRGGHSWLVFDRAVLHTGDAARAEARRRGVQAEDYLVTNDNPRLRRLPLAEDVRVRGNLLLSGSTEGQDASLPDLERYTRAAGTTPLPVVLALDKSGDVTSITEPYLP